jgi:uncharacterized protein YkwD
MPISRAIPALLVTAIALVAAAPGHATPDPAAPPAARPAGAERALVAGINAVRARHHLPPLRRVIVLTRSARSHSRDLVARGAFTHDSADGSPFHLRLVAAGFPRGRAASENLAEVGGCDAGAGRAALRMWMASPPHRANLLDATMRVAGIGFAVRGRCATTVVTADFGG